MQPVIQKSTPKTTQNMSLSPHSNQILLYYLSSGQGNIQTRKVCFYIIFLYTFIFDVSSQAEQLIHWNRRALAVFRVDFFLSDDEELEKLGN